MAELQPWEAVVSRPYSQAEDRYGWMEEGLWVALPSAGHSWVADQSAAARSAQGQLRTEMGHRDLVMLAVGAQLGHKGS